MTGRLGIALCFAFAGGCTLPPRGERPPPATPVAAAAGGLQCHMQHITGTLIATRVCTLKEQRDAIQQDTQDARDFLDRSRIEACTGNGKCGLPGN